MGRCRVICLSYLIFCLNILHFKHGYFEYMKIMIFIKQKVNDRFKKYFKHYTTWYFTKVKKIKIFKIYNSSFQQYLLLNLRKWLISHSSSQFDVSHEVLDLELREWGLSKQKVHQTKLNRRGILSSRLL